MFRKSPISFPNNSALSRYRRVTMSGGYLAYADAGTRCFGSLDRALQTTDAQGAVRLRNSDGTLTYVASEAITQFAKVYAGASGKVAASGGVLEGIALQAASADGDEIEVLPVSMQATDRLYVAVAASTAVTNTTVETAFDSSFAIPANTLKAGDTLRIRAQVIATGTNSTDTLTLKLKLGTTVIIATAAVDVADGDIGFFDALITIRTAGATGTMVATGTQGLGVPGTVTAKPFLLASTTIDTTAAITAQVTATWSVANAGNTCRLDNMVIEKLAA